jgi:ribosomal protein S27AE
MSSGSAETDKMGRVCILKKFGRCSALRGGQSPAGNSPLFSIPTEKHLQEQYMERFGWPPGQPFPKSGYICATHFDQRHLYHDGTRVLRRDGEHTLPMELDVPLHCDEDSSSIQVLSGQIPPVLSVNVTTPLLDVMGDGLDEPFEPRLGVSTPFVTRTQQGPNIRTVASNGPDPRSLSFGLAGNYQDSDLSHTNTSAGNQTSADPTWYGSASVINNSSAHDSDGCDSEEDEPAPPVPAPLKYVLVSYKKLNELLRFCPKCGHPAVGLQWQKRRLGAYVGTDITCSNSRCHGYSWRSSELRRKMPEVRICKFT